MQSIFTWIMAHSAFMIVIVYELWSLIPSTVVSSSSILTWIGTFISGLAKNSPNPPPAP